MSRLSAVPNATPHVEDIASAMIRTSLRILAAYLLVTAIPLILWSYSARSWWALAAHAAAFGTAVFFGGGKRKFAGVLQDWIPLALGPFLYVELRWIIEGAGQPHADALVSGWETRLFDSQPSQALALRWPSLALSELLHLCYISYYALVYVPPALLWLRGRRREFAETVLALVVVYAICFVVYAIFPVDGPRYLNGPSMAPDGPIRDLVMRVLASASSRGTAFPSSHVAASVVAAICALRFQGRLGWLVTALAVGLGLGAVYGGYHYGVDVAAGVVAGLVAAAVARSLERDLGAEVHLRGAS